MTRKVFNSDLDLDKIPELKSLIRYESVESFCNRHQNVIKDFSLYDELSQLENDIVNTSNILISNNDDSEKENLIKIIDKYNKLINEFFINNFKELILFEDEVDVL